MKFEWPGYRLMDFSVRVKGWSHRTITTAGHLPMQMGCMRLNVYDW